MRTVFWAATSVTLAAAILALVISKRKKRCRRKSTIIAVADSQPRKGCADFHSPVSASNTRLLSSSVIPIVLAPGLVLLKGAVSPENQVAVAREMFLVGHGKRRWWCQAESRHALPTSTPRSVGTESAGIGEAMPPSTTPTTAGNQESVCGGVGTIDKSTGSLVSDDGDPRGRSSRGGASGHSSQGSTQGSSQTPPLEWQLTGERQGRGRVYDHLSSFQPQEGASALQQLCKDCVDLCGRQEHGGNMPGAAQVAPPTNAAVHAVACSVSTKVSPGTAAAGPGVDLTQKEEKAGDSEAAAAAAAAAASASSSWVGGTPYECTHLLVLYYALERKLGWHRDDGPIDGSSDLPVVSLSLGNTCDFLLKSRESESPPKHSVSLESGDVILFGGPARRLLHTVSKIHPHTTPPRLVELQSEMQPLAPNPEFAAQASSGFRMNLTFRHAPELCGQEAGERFYHFAGATRGFLATQEAKGTHAAREEAKQRAEERKRKKALKQKAKKDTTGQAAVTAVEVKEKEGRAVT